MLTVFFNYRGVIHYEFLPTRQTVNKEYYVGVMRHLREAIHKKRPELWANNSWILHHDNVPSHTALFLREFFAKDSTHVDLALCGFWLFPKLKRPLRGNRFESIEEIERETMEDFLCLIHSREMVGYCCVWIFGKLVMSYNSILLCTYF